MRYTELSLFFGEYAQIAIGENENAKWGLINRSGEEVVPTIYDSIFYMGGKYAVVNIGRKTDLENMEFDDGLNGVITTSNELIIALQYSELYFVDDSYSLLIAQDVETEKFGVIDLENNIIIPFVYNMIEPTINNLFAVETLGGRWGIIDINQNKIIEPQYDHIHSEWMHSKNKEPWFVAEKGSEKFYIDLDNNRVLF